MGVEDSLKRKGMWIDKGKEKREEIKFRRMKMRADGRVFIMRSWYRQRVVGVREYLEYL